MTREEEIRILQTAFEILDRMVKWYHGTSHDFKIGENDIKALEVAKIAIEAMQTEPCEDAISRQAAIDALNDLYYKVGFYEKDGVAKSQEVVNDLPSVQPEPKTGYISIADVMSVFDDFMCGEVDEDGTETFLEMLKDKAESGDKE